MHLAVFKEFASAAVLDAVRALPLTVDVAPEACATAKTESELAVVSTNAKLMFLPEEANEEAVNAVLAKLEALGFEITVRFPRTSTGCPMTDRVILKLRRSE